MESFHGAIVDQILKEIDKQIVDKTKASTAVD